MGASTPWYLLRWTFGRGTSGITNFANLTNSSILSLSGSAMGTSTLPQFVSADVSSYFKNGTSPAFGPPSKGGSSPHGLRVFQFTSGNAPSTWSVPEGVTTIKIVAIGGGAGLYPGATYSASGGRGNTYLPVVPGASLTISVGGGGIDGNVSSSTPSAGGDTTITYNTTTIVAGGGRAATSSTMAGMEGAVGVISGPTLEFAPVDMQRYGT